MEVYVYTNEKKIVCFVFLSFNYGGRYKWEKVFWKQILGVNNIFYSELKAYILKYLLRIKKLVTA